MNTAETVYKCVACQVLEQIEDQTLQTRCRYYVDITFSPKAEYLAAGSPHRHRAQKTFIGETCSDQLQLADRLLEDRQLTPIPQHPDSAGDQADSASRVRYSSRRVDATQLQA